MVFNFGDTDVFKIVATTFTFAALPKMVESVIVSVVVPLPDIVSAILTSCPCTPVPPPAVKIETT